MKVRYCILFLIVLVFSKGSLSAQDHLHPTPDTFSDFQFRHEYYSNVREILMKELSFIPKAQLVILASFSKEVIWQVQYDGDVDKYYSVTSKANHSIWSNQTNDKPKKIKAKITSAEITKETADLIARLFSSALKTVRYPESERIGLDGANYYFSSLAKSGTIWSPRKESKMRRLVDICYELMRQTLEGENLTEEVVAEIEQLISELE